MTEQEYRWATEVLRDAESHHRLTQWEEEFCDDMRARLLSQGEGYPISDRQLQTIRRVEEKIYR